jgi:FtsP/CotA-like multicopper oxidase with cupredoxin domain
MKLKSIPILLLALWSFSFAGAMCDPIEMDDVAAEQAKEKVELDSMKNELKGIKGEVNSAIDSMGQLTNMLNEKAANPAKEFHLFARESFVDVGGGVKVKALTYNGSIPGPQLDVLEGQPIRIVLHNQTKVPTSLHFHGMIVPHDVDGLPRSKASNSPNPPPGKPAKGGAFSTTGGVAVMPLPERFVKPGDSYGYQFVPQTAGTFYYHPQVVHLEQRLRGMYGALVVHPRSEKRADVDQVLLIGELRNDNEPPPRDGSQPKPIYIVNGKTAPSIPPIEVRAGERVRLRLINVSEEAVPLHLSGHKLEVVSNNGSDLLEPQVFRDTITLNPGERMDVEFTASNIGVWSLASEKVSQTTSGGKFPGGIAMFVRYQEMKGSN